MPGDTVEVITYWRAEGPLLPDLTLKTHILSSPVTPIAIHDTILRQPGADARTRCLHPDYEGFPAAERAARGTLPYPWAPIGKAI